MADMKLNGNSQRVGSFSRSGRRSSTPSLNCSTQNPIGGCGSAAQGRDLDFSTSSVQNIADNGAFYDLYEASYDNVSTSAILNYCKLKVLRPYFRLHSLLGWRPLFLQQTYFENNFYVKGVNATYTVMILAFIVLGYVLQQATCYRQDGFRYYKSPPEYDPQQQPLAHQQHRHLTFVANFINDSNVNDQYYNATDESDMFNSTMDKFSGTGDDDPSVEDQENVKANSNGTTGRPGLRPTNNKIRPAPTNMSQMENEILKCRGNFFAMYLIPDVLHFFAYLFILHLMRTPESERLENLMERGFIQTSRTTGWFLAHRRLVRALRCFLWICVCWLLVSLTIHGLAVGTRLYQNQLDFTWLHPTPKLKIVLVCLTILTLTSNDLICGAIVTSYCVHCQLNISYITNLCASIRERRLEFQEFYKRVEESRKFIDYLNSDQALAIALLQVNIGCKLATALYALLASSEIKNWSPNTLAVVLLSVFFWISLFCLPLIQGTRLTNSCRELKRIGHELRSRPFGYQDADQKDLDSLLQYTTTLSMEAKILHVPIRSSNLVVISVILLIIILMLGQLGLLNV